MTEPHTGTRDTKPTGGAAPAGAKGAKPEGQMGAPLSPTGPNETEDGIIKAPAPEGPGTDQIGLVGGDPSEPLQSTPPLEDDAGVAPSKKTADKDKADKNAPHSTR